MEKETEMTLLSSDTHPLGNIDEDMVKDMAQVIVDKGLRELGYTYVNL